MLQAVKNKSFNPNRRFGPTYPRNVPDGDDDGSGDEVQEASGSGGMAGFVVEKVGMFEVVKRKKEPESEEASRVRNHTQSSSGGGIGRDGNM